MSRKGDCWDNSVAESFFATLRAELVDDARYPTRRAAEHSIGQYIDGSTTPSGCIPTSTTSVRSRSN
jgi:transposase InsO family protein